MKKFLFGVLLFASTLIISGQELDLCCKNALHHFVAVKEEDHLDYDVMFTIFSSMTFNSKELLSAIRTDIMRCNRYIRRNANDCESHRLLREQLRSFFNYVKKHKHCCTAISLHNDLKERYALAFNNPAIVQAVNETPHLFGISQKCKNKCKAYFNQVLVDLAKIDRFEDYLHGDYSILKAHNYVYKIELIKVRNAIYHNNMYKYETSYF